MVRGRRFHQQTSHPPCHGPTRHPISKKRATPGLFDCAALNWKSCLAGCPPASKVGCLALFLLFLAPQTHSARSLVYDSPGHSQHLLLPRAQREADGILPEEAGWRSPPSADGSFSFLCRAQEATELLPEDLLQVRHGLGRQACACLCLGVGTCPVPACHLPCLHIQVTGLGSAHVRRVTPGPWH